MNFNRNGVSGFRWNFWRPRLDGWKRRIPNPAGSEWLRVLGGIFLVGFLYYAGARLGFAMALRHGNATPVWPAAGVALAGLMIWGRHAWIGIWIASFVANAAQFRLNAVADLSTILGVSAAIACGNTVEALAGWWLCRRWLGWDTAQQSWFGALKPEMFRTTGVFLFLASAVAMSLIGALIGPTAIYVGGIADWQHYLVLTLTWWAGDALGVLLFAPLLLAASRPLSLHWKPGRWLETVAAFTLLGLACWGAFDHWFSFGGRVLRAEFLPIAPLIWIALRLGPRATASAVAIIACCAVWQTYLGFGPFVLDTRHNSLVFMEAYLWVVAIIGLALETLESDVTVRQKAQDSIKRRNERLQILSDCLAQLVSTQRTDRIVSDLFPRVAAHIGADAYFNYLRTPEVAGCKLVSRAGVSEKEVCEICSACSGSALFCRAARTRALVEANDIQHSDDPQYSRVRAGGIQSCVCLPLIVEDRLLGVLSCASRSKPRFKTHDLEFLQFISRYVAIALDRARSEEILRERKQRLQLALDAARMGTWELDLDGEAHSPPTDREIERAIDTARLSPEFERMIGLLPGEFKSAEDWASRLHANDREHTLKAFRSAICGTDAFDIEHRYVWPDHTIHWLHCRGVLVRDASGTPHRFVGVSVDTTARKQDEERIHLISRCLAQLLAERDPDHILGSLYAELANYAGADCCINYFADCERREILLHAALGVSEEFQHGIRRMRFGEGLCGRVAESAGTLIVDDLQHSADPDTWFLRDLGIQSYVGIPLLVGERLLGTLAFASKGKPHFSQDELDFLQLVSAYIAIAMDRARGERDLLRAKQAAERASNAKNLFIAALSHELRTPLTPALMTATSLEEEEAIAAPFREQIAELRHSIELESRLIDDLLDLTRIERGTFSLRPENVDVHEVLARAVAIVREDALLKRLTINSKADAKWSVAHADPLRLQQVFWNLLKNAVKFTPARGNIRVRTFNPSSNSIAVEIKDTGIGIAPGDKDRIFSPFEQGPATGDHRYGGLGLGLAIAKSIIELHAGSITAASDGLTQGAVFTVTFPIIAFAKAEPVPKQSQPRPRQDHFHILLVEDNEQTRTILTRLLSRDGHEVDAEPSCAAAKEAARAQTHPFEVLISDIGLPDGSGFNLVRELKAETPDITAIALSGYGTPEDVDKSIQAGFRTHLTKPISLEELRRALTTRNGIHAA